jgi:hypothetical protein
MIMAENTQTNGAVDVLAVLREYARDTGAFRVTNQAATRLAAACAAAAEVYAQRDVAMAFADEMEEDAAYSSGEEAASVIRRQVLDEYARKLRAALARVGGSK